MNEVRFWEIIARACPSDPERWDEWEERLQGELRTLPPEEIIAWSEIFDRLANRAYTNDLWGAAYLINGGASDDGFFYFRCWLIGMGRDVYEAALANPDGLADVVTSDSIAEAETYASAREAWMAVTGRSLDDPYPARHQEEPELRGDNWDFDDDEEVRRRLPRLAALCLDS